MVLLLWLEYMKYMIGVVGGGQHTALNGEDMMAQSVADVWC